MSAEFEQKLLQTLADSGSSSILTIMLEQLNAGIILIEWSSKTIHYTNKYIREHPLWVGSIATDPVEKNLLDIINDKTLTGYLTVDRFEVFNCMVTVGEGVYEVDGNPIYNADGSFDFIYLTTIERTKRARLAEHISVVMDQIHSESSAIRNEAETVLDSTQQVMIMANSLAEQSSDVTETVHNVAAATTELTQSIGEVSHHFDKVSSVLNEAGQRANQATDTVALLDKASHNITNVVKLIDDIASKTNLLALNATIEAARAGEAGRGFAVVAGEVKSLSGQTKDATQGIEQNIAEIRNTTDDVVKTMGLLKESMGEINQTTDTVNQVALQQNQATLDISDKINNAAQVTADVTENMQQIRAGADVSGNSAQNMFKSLRELVTLTGVMREDILSIISSSEGEVPESSTKSKKSALDSPVQAAPVQASASEDFDDDVELF
ncbi:methyl-accepting chemotaxis protein [Temperatibacter marinus]|uniref:Methyl-accepting chemotaxis protein n=1 Tax=Temperatibacter marinus TaxID=1456591 RepID=A0AA52EG62_9PROT|nr:methyl-accepting chemotaxis protein [Temperatibacter marinus]WND01724.1 methyl-accepting chemotaxis protein [Temperatibacter marinus]